MNLNFTPKLKASVPWLKHSKEKRHKKYKGEILHDFTDRYQYHKCRHGVRKPSQKATGKTYKVNFT